MVYLNSISGPLVNISVFERILKWFMLSLQRMFCRLSNYSAKMTIGQKSKEWQWIMNQTLDLGIENGRSEGVQQGNDQWTK